MAIRVGWASARKIPALKRRKFSCIPLLPDHARRPTFLTLLGHRLGKAAVAETQSELAEPASWQAPFGAGRTDLYAKVRILSIRSEDAAPMPATGGTQASPPGPRLPS